MRRASRRPTRAATKPVCDGCATDTRPLRARSTPARASPYEPTESPPRLDRITRRRSARPCAPATAVPSIAGRRERSRERGFRRRSTCAPASVVSSAETRHHHSGLQPSRRRASPQAVVAAVRPWARLVEAVYVAAFTVGSEERGPGRGGGRFQSTRCRRRGPARAFAARGRAPSGRGAGAAAAMRSRARSSTRSPRRGSSPPANATPPPLDEGRRCRPDGRP